MILGRVILVGQHPCLSGSPETNDWKKDTYAHFTLKISHFFSCHHPSVRIAWEDGHLCPARGKGVRCLNGAGFRRR
jgi:hypothetical protein